MKKIIRDYLTFNKRERNGVFVLVAIIILLIIYLNVSDKFVRADTIDFSKFEKQVDSFNLALEAMKDSAETPQKRISIQYESINNTPTQKAERFNFDPNNLSENDWKRLGLSDKQIKTIKNYESKGGTFRKKEDVKKMYCIKPELYVSLEPYIQIEDRLSSSPSLFFSKGVPSDKERGPRGEFKNKSTAIIELNGADSSELTTIKGIGPYFAKSIIKYRDQLGGFALKEQLLEVWKFDQEKYDLVQKFITVDPASVKKININTCTAQELKHPYIKWNVANAIVNYRTIHGKFKTIQDIQRTDLVDDETLRKIVPYLIVELEK